MVVCEKRITLYRDILTGTPSRWIQHLDDVRDPEEPGSSGRPPIWVQWARPMRAITDTFTVDMDGIYLCREDGIVQYLTLNHVDDYMLDSTHNPGRLGINVCTAFAILDLGPNTADVLAAGGDMGEGGLWRSSPRQYLEHHTSVPNWTPLNDFITISHSAEPFKAAGSVTNADKASRMQQRMFACTGRGRQGAIAELRYGCEASKEYEDLDLGDEVSCGVLGIWAFHGFYGEAGQQDKGRERLKDTTYILISCPTRTFLLHMPLKPDPELITEYPELDYNAEKYDPNMITVDLGLEYNARSIAAGSTPRGFIQVTENSIRAISLPLPQEQAIKVEDQEDVKPNKKFMDRWSRARYCFNFEDSRVVAACIYDLAEKTFILVAVQQAENFCLQLGHLDAGYEPAITTPLRSQPSCLLLRRVGHHLLAFVGTLEKELLVYARDSDGYNFEAVSRYEFQDPFAICDSLAIITSSNNDDEQLTYIVVCGLRNGSLKTLYLGADYPRELIPLFSCEVLMLILEDPLCLCEELQFGHTSVTVIPDETRKSRAIIHCEKVLCTLEYPQHSKPPATVHRVWMTDHNQPDLRTSSLSAITQAVDSWLPESVPGHAAGFLFCIDGDLLLQSVSIDPNPWPKMIPRRLPVGGSPIRVISSTHLKKLIVLYTKATIIRPRPTNGQRNTPGKRALLPRIAFLDPDNVPAPPPDPDAMDVEDEVKLDQNDALMDSERKPGERFLGITEWFPHIGGNEYHMLVMNTMLTRARKPIGRLLFFAISPGAGSSAMLTLKKKIEFESPIYSVAPYPDGKSIVYCSGSELCISSLDLGPSGIKWQPPLKAAMRSPARHLTIVEPLIYVSSTRESLAVFRYETERIVYQYGDQSARDGIHHVHMPERSLVLASDATNTVVGLWQPPERRIDNAMSTVFEAVLPGSITKLRRVTRPLWHRKTVMDEEDESVIGSSADGTVTQFDILEKGWKLLRFIQNMVERNPLICPFAGLQPHKRHIEPSTARPHFMHINGDILERVLERGGEDCLRDLLNVEPDLDSHTDFDSIDDRWERFKELAGEVVDVGDGDWLANVVQWVRYRLRSAL
ncbi:hypothetical protein OEA41_007886 [Lepraria neglecta]|uniref:RSE1/DDB1/CPSF1 first beta-propeller domain-containing protein n=1 Tax=Lepraria neglecta TaxID=209136 RepID=A0AAE0DNC8_9LECA|nr:hypothetical protein OEA41_007886 [Lepraria neglecta]